MTPESLKEMRKAYEEAAKSPESMYPWQVAIGELLGEINRLEMEQGWVGFMVKHPPKGHAVLVTNNLTAMDAHGCMAHVWITYPQLEDSGEWVGFLDDGQRIRLLSHWMPLPSSGVRHG